MDAELADAGEHAGEGEQGALNVVGGVHVRRVEARDHGIDAPAVLLRQSQVFLRDHRVHERIVVQVGVRTQVVIGRVVARQEVVPFLLQRDPEHGHPPDATGRHVQIIPRRSASLDVVQEV